MVNKELIKYITSEEYYGYTESQLRKVLLDYGYKQKEIDQALAHVRKKKLLPSKKIKTNPSSKLSIIKKRNPWLVLLLSIITLGIYSIYWLISTNNQLKKLTKSAPNIWLLVLGLIPLLGLIFLWIWLWQYSKSINELTGYDNVLLFILFFFLFPVAMFIVQSELNKKATN